MISAHTRFHYRTLDELKNELDALGTPIPLSQDLSVLGTPIDGAPNRLVFQPMEGCDGTADGAPGELTLRRYKKYAAGGAGMIWFEAVAILPQARANPRQLWMTEKNVDDFKRIADMMREESMSANGYAPKLILQATHSGRYSKPDGKPAPIIAYNNPIFEGDNPIDASRIITDDELKRAEEAYAVTTRLAVRAGFDGIDVKCCHRYLNSELLSAFTRPGIYGGSYENRTRFFKNSLDSVKAAAGGGRDTLTIASRMNAYDGFPYPYGFGVSNTGDLAPCMDEPIKLIGEIYARGLSLLNVTMGNPYFNPHVNRPYDHGGYLPDEHPLAGVARMLANTALIQKAYPELPVICSGLTYLREFAPLAAAGMIMSGGAAMAGFGREGFAYPDFPRDILKNGGMDRSKCCVCCSKCTELMRAGSVTGCIVRDSEKYLPLYKEFVTK